MAAIAEIISGAIQGVGNIITKGMKDADARYTQRMLEGADIRGKSAFQRNLPLVIVAVVLLLIFIIPNLKKK